MRALVAEKRPLRGCVAEDRRTEHERLAGEQAEAGVPEFLRRAARAREAAEERSRQEGDGAAGTAQPGEQPAERQEQPETARPALRPARFAAAARGGPGRDAADIDEQQAAPEEIEERGPIVPERPDTPLIRPSLDIPYDGPVSLPNDIIQLAPAAGASKPDPADIAAVESARREFSRIVDAARSQHAELKSFVERSTLSIIDRCHALEDRAVGFFGDAGRALDSASTPLEMAVDATVDQAITDIGRASRQARRVVYGTASAAMNRIRANADTAGAQVTAIIHQLAQNYTDLLTRTANEIRTKGTEAANSITTFVNTGAASFPEVFYAIDDARNEARRMAIPGLARQRQAVEQTRDRGEQGYRDQIEPVRSQFRDSELGQALNTRKNEIRGKGKEAVDKAVSTAIKSLESQTKAAKKTAREMGKNGKATLAASRKAARARIVGQGRQLLAAAYGETRGALNGMGAAARAGLPAFGNMVTAIERSLRKAGDSGPRPLENATRQSANDAVKRLPETGRLQREKLGLCETNTARSIEAREAGTRSHVEQDRDGTIASMTQSANESANLIPASAKRQTDSFADVAQGVTNAAQQWEAPLATVFAEAIEQTRKQQLEATGEGSFNHWSTQIDTQKNEFISGAFTPYLTPLVHFRPVLDAAADRVTADLDDRLGRLIAAFNYGIIDTVNESGATGALRGLTAIQGRAMRLKFRNDQGISLDRILPFKLDGDDYEAAINYLAGNTAAGAAAELRASIHWYNDEEGRIEDIMRSLTPDELAELHRSSDGTEALNYVRDHLGGTDVDVFDALSAGNHARADAFRMRDRIDEARRDGDMDALHTVLAEYSRQSTDRGWETENADARRTAVQQELAFILEGGEAGAAGSTISPEAAANRVEEYVLRPVDVVQYQGGGEPQVVTLHVTGANRDLASALIRFGEGSVEARAARLGVEIQRSDEPNVLNLDTALVDPRLNPNNDVSEEERARAIADRERMFQLFAERYGGSNEAGTAATAQAFAEARLRQAMGDDELGATLVGNMVRETHPSPRTAAIAMQYAGIHRTGTDEDLMFRFSERMNRDEVAQMRLHYAVNTGRNLDADLGLYGNKGWFTEVSGDDRLRLERAFLGVPRNDRERAEVAAFAAQQQRDNTGGFGSWLASGSMQDRSLTYNTERLQAAMGATVRIDENGRPVWTGPGNFDEEGNYTGGDREEFSSAMRMAKISAENYATRIDAYANFAATAIAIVGAVAAAVATVVTGGAASPLLMAAIAGATGLASMGARYAISGSRYGWEQALTDLGMTAVQALTAGVGQHIAIVSRGGAQGFLRGMTSFRSAQGLASGMGRITGNAFGDMVLMGAATGGLGGLGNAALNERTWDKGIAAGFGSMIEGMFKGALSGAATSAVSNAFESVPIARAAGGGRLSIGDVMGRSSNPFVRGMMRGTSSALGGMAGRGTEISLDALGGRYRGDAGDAFVSIAEAGGQAFVQDALGGAVEAPIHGRMERRAAARATAETPTTPRLPGGAGPETTGPRPPELPEAPVPPRVETPEVTTPRRTETEEGPRRPAEPAEPGPAPRPAEVPATPRTAAETPGGRTPTAAETRPAVVPEAPRPAPPAEAPRPVAPPETTPTRPVEAAEAPATRPPRRATEEGSFADFDSLIRELRNSQFGYELEAAKRAAPPGLDIDPALSRRRAIERAYRESRAAPPAGRLSPGEQIQHWTKVLDVTRNLPPGMAVLTPDAINANRSWLQSRIGQPAHTLLTDPAGGGTRYIVAPIEGGRPYGGAGEPLGPREQLFLRGMEPPPPEHVYNTEHKFADQYLIPEISQQIQARRRELGLPPLDPRALAIAAGEQARWVMEGTPGTEMSGRSVELGRAGPQQMLLAPEHLLPDLAARGLTVEPGPAPVRAPAADERQLTLPFERQPESGQLDLFAPRPTGEAPEPPTTRPPREPDTEPPTRPTTPEPEGPSGTASAVSDRFRGDALPPDPSRIANAAAKAVDRLTAPGGQFEGVSRPPADNVFQFGVTARNGDQLEIQLQITTNIKPSDDGTIPVARFRHDPETGRYIVEVSAGARPAEIERALAHEIAEIRSVHGRQGNPPPDALTPGAQGRKLSPHDEGRLAEFEVLARQIAEAQAKGDTATVTRLRDDAEHLAAHMGLVGDSKAAQARVELARAALPADSPARLVLEHAMTLALTNPFLQKRTGKLDTDLEILALRLERAEQMGDQHLIASVEQDARRLLLTTGTIEKIRKNAISIDRRTIDRVAAAGTETARRLLAVAERLAMRAPVLSDAERRLIGEQRRPDEGYEARYVQGEAPRARRDVRPDPGAVHRLENDRIDLIRQRDQLETAIAKETDQTRRQALIDQRNDVRRQINLVSEQLGMMAGRAFAEQALKLPPEAEVKFDRQGAGLPDLVYEGPSGRLVVIECKGGSAELGVRRSADGTLLVQQGTPEYLHSLATEMARSSDPRVRDVGERILIELAKTPPNIDYYHASQPIGKDGRCGTPVIGRFDLSKNG